MGAKEEREARLAAQLRGNLRKRKAAPIDGEQPPARPEVDKQPDD